MQTFYQESNRNPDSYFATVPPFIWFYSFLVLQMAFRQERDRGNWRFHRAGNFGRESGWRVFRVAIEPDT